MVETLIFVATNLAVFYIIYWLMQNDGSTRVEEHNGLTRIKPGKAHTKPERRKSGTTPGKRLSKRLS